MQLPPPLIAFGALAFSREMPVVWARGSRIAGVLEIKLIEVPFETEYKHAE